MGRATPISAVVYLGGKNWVDDLRSTGEPIAASFSNFDIGTSSRVDDVPDALLWRVMDFSGFVAITNSGSSSSCL